MKRFIDVHVPVTTCTLRCHYCYITHNRLFDNKLPTFKYSPDRVRKALSKERLGGVCMFNLCGGGETLLPPEVPQYIKALLEEGHYVMVVTNATVDRAFDEIEKFPPELMKRLFFKFSYHYLQLKERGLIDRFFKNIEKMQKAGASFTVEATPSDELSPYIEEMNNIAIQYTGAKPHITVARDERNMKEVAILTNRTREEYKKTWSVNDSPLFDYKLSVFNQKRTEFCYAGDWTFSLDLGTGILSQCICSLYRQNIFDNVEEPIRFKAIGHHCLLPHCWNAHAYLSFGSIPEHQAPTYDTLRNRVREDGSEWLKPEMKAFMQCKLKEANNEYSESTKKKIDCEMTCREALRTLKHSVVRFIKRK